MNTTHARVARRSLRICTVALCAATAACVSPPIQIRDLGGDAHEMTKRSGILADRADQLKADVDLQAFAYCRDRGLAMAVLDSKVVDPDPPAYASATVQFRCVAP